MTALIAPLLLAVALLSGCASAPSRKSPTVAAPQAARSLPAAGAVSPSSGLLTAVEAPTMGGDARFENAPNVEESPQVRSMREQMARKYGCCGK